MRPPIILDKSRQLLNIQTNNYPMKFLPVIIAVSALACVLQLPVSAQNFSQQNIEINNSVKDIIIKDSNNDGIQEIIFQQGRNLLVYSLRPQSNRFFENLSYRLPNDACLYDINPSLLPFIKAGVEEAQFNLAYVNNKGVYLIPLDLSAAQSNLPVAKVGLSNSDLGKTPITPTQFVISSTLFKNRTVNTPLFQNIIFDQGGSNKIMVIPNNNKFLLVDCIEKFPLIQEINMPMPSFISPNNNNIFESLTSETSLPAFVFEDLNADKHKDLIFINNTISACLYENGKYGKINNVLSMPTDAFDPNQEIDFGYILTPLISDINNDACVDVLCTNDTEGLIYVYLNHINTGIRKDFPAVDGTFFSATPNQVIRTGKWIIEHNLIDLNGDLLNDLVLVQMSKLGIMGGLQAILAQTLEWEITVYLAQPDAKNNGLIYSKSPDYSRLIKLPFTFSYASPLSLAGGRTPPKIRSPYIWSLEGDYNGDKINDLLISGTKDGTIEIYFGETSKLFSPTPSMILNLLSFKNGYRLSGMPHGAPIVAEINNDKKSDIIIPLVRENADKSFSNSFEIFLSY